MGWPPWPWPYLDSYGAYPYTTYSKWPFSQALLTSRPGMAPSSSALTPYVLVAGDAVTGATWNVRAAANAMVKAVRVGVSRSQPPAWKPTHDFQEAFNWGYGPWGGLGHPSQPELLKVDGIYSSRTELALSRVLGGMPQLMALYGALPSGTAAAGADVDPTQLAEGARVNYLIRHMAEQIAAEKDDLRTKYNNPTAWEYTVIRSIDRLRALGAHAVRNLGPALDLLTDAMSKPSTQRAWQINAQLAAVGYPGGKPKTWLDAPDAQQAIDLASQMQLLYAGAMCASPVGRAVGAPCQ